MYLYNIQNIKYPIQEALVQVYTTSNGKTLKIIFIWKKVFEYNSHKNETHLYFKLWLIYNCQLVQLFIWFIS